MPTLPARLDRPKTRGKTLKDVTFSPRNSILLHEKHEETWEGVHSPHKRFQASAEQ